MIFTLCYLLVMSVIRTHTHISLFIRKVSDGKGQKGHNWHSLNRKSIMEVCTKFSWRAATRYLLTMWLMSEYPLQILEWLFAIDYFHLASSALVKRMMALALLTRRLVTMLWNLASSALEGTFSWTAMQMFRLAAWHNIHRVTPHRAEIKYLWKDVGILPISNSNMLFDDSM